MGESPRDKGVVVGSPAYEAGVAEHDIVLSIDGEKITRDRTIQDILENRNVGDTIELSILRNGKPLTLRVLLAERK